MASTWNDLAGGARWSGIVSFICNWVGPLEPNVGMSPGDLDAILQSKRLNLSTAVREWYVLAAKWEQREDGLNVWIPPREFKERGGSVGILTDPEGVNLWGVRLADVDIEDPPVYDLEEGFSEMDFPTFSGFVGAMIVGDVIFNYEIDEPWKLSGMAARAALTCLTASRRGVVLVDGPLESATVVAYGYGRNGEVFGRSRTPAGRELLQQLRRPSRKDREG